MKGLEKLREDIADDPTGKKAKLQRGDGCLQIDIDQDGTHSVTGRGFDSLSVPGIEYRDISDADERGKHALPVSISSSESLGTTLVHGSEIQAIVAATHSAEGSAKVEEDDSGE